MCAVSVLDQVSIKTIEGGEPSEINTVVSFALDSTLFIIKNYYSLILYVKVNSK